MTTTRTPRSGSAGQRSAAMVDALPLALVIVAEAAWISVVAALVQEYVLRPPSLGIPSMVAFVVGGVAAARLLGRRAAARWPVVALGLTALGAAAGWLAAPETWAAIISQDLGRALGTHPGGWLAGVAVLRGIAHASLPLAEATVARLLGIGIPGLAIVAAAGGLIAEPWRSGFLAHALVASIIFAASGTLGLAFARLDAVSGDARLVWRRNPAWAGLLAVLVVTAVALALPVSTVAGTAIGWLFGLAMGSLLVLGLIASFQQAGRRILALAFGAGCIILVAAQFASPGVPGTTPSVGAGGQVVTADPVDPLTAAGLGGLVLLLAAAAVIVLARLWMRRVVAPPDDDVAETRSIDEGPFISPGHRGRGRRRRSSPVDAAGAYVALITDLEARPLARRAPSETPAEHARRLRHAGRAGLSLELLAADYALARFGGLQLSEAEDRRALERWRRLRVRLGRETRPGAAQRAST